MKGVPNIYWVRTLAEMTQSVQQSTPWGSYTPARPLGFHGLCLRRRLNVAWKVFTGEYDAVSWTPPRTHNCRIERWPHERN